MAGALSVGAQCDRAACRSIPPPHASTCTAGAGAAVGDSAGTARGTLDTWRRLDATERAACASAATSCLRASRARTSARLNSAHAASRAAQAASRLARASAYRCWARAYRFDARLNTSHDTRGAPMPAAIRMAAKRWADISDSLEGATTWGLASLTAIEACWMRPGGGNLEHPSGSDVVVDALGNDPGRPKRQLYRLPRVHSGLRIHAPRPHKRQTLRIGRALDT